MTTMRGIQHSVIHSNRNVHDGARDDLAFYHPGFFFDASKNKHKRYVRHWKQSRITNFQAEAAGVTAPDVVDHVLAEVSPS